MSERKLYLVDLNGGRYEVTVDELKQMAYSGKIRREDKIFLTEVKDGKTREIETVCGKVRVAAESFAQGEADRKTERELAMAQKEAEEVARIALENQKVAEFIKENQQRDASMNNLRFGIEDTLFESAQFAVNRFVAIIRFFVWSSAIISVLGSLVAIYVESYGEAYNKASDIAYEEAYSEAYNKVVDLYQEKVARLGNNDSGDEQFALIEAETAGRKAGEESRNSSGDEAGKKAGKKAGTKALLIFTPILVILACLSVWVILFSVKCFMDIPLRIALYQTESVKLALANVVDRTSADHHASNGV